MANDDRQSQLFIREVDEELRREQLKSIWDRFAPLIIGVCVLVVALTAGYRGWDWWQARQAAAAGDRFTAAVQALESGNRTEGEAQLAQIAESGDDGYAALARLRLAGEKAAAGAKPEALAAYDAIAADANVAESLRSLARIRASLLALDTGDVAGARERAEPLNQSGGSWRHAAREVLGTAAYQAGELQQARDRFNEIQQDAETPPDLWMRSGMMLAVIDGALPAPGAPPAPAGIAPPAEAAPVEGALPVAPGEPPAAAVPPGAAPAPAAESSAVEPAAGEPPPNPESAPLQPAPAPAPSADPLRLLQPRRVCRSPRSALARCFQRCNRRLRHHQCRCPLRRSPFRHPRPRRRPRRLRPLRYRRLSRLFRQRPQRLPKHFLRPLPWPRNQCGPRPHQPHPRSRRQFRRNRETLRT
jgi:hypothetical protein